jgi:hypothetical protein
MLNNSTNVNYNTGNRVNTNLNSSSTLNMNTVTNYAITGNNSSLDPDEQFVLDIIRTTKQESIQNLIDLNRVQECKSILLIRLLERYKDQLNNKDMVNK